MYFGIRVITGVVFLVLHLSAYAIGHTFYVSPDGNDDWSGGMSQPAADKSDGPLATLTGARDKIRKLKSAGPLAEPVEVVIADGVYSMRQ